MPNFATPLHHSRSLFSGTRKKARCRGTPATHAPHTAGKMRNTHTERNAHASHALTQHTLSLTQRYTTHAPVQQHRRTRQTGKRHVLTQTTRAHLNINTALTTHQRTRGRMHVRAHHRNSRICVRTRHPSQFQVMAYTHVWTYACTHELSDYPVLVFSIPRSCAQRRRRRMLKRMTYAWMFVCTHAHSCARVYLDNEICASGVCRVSYVAQAHASLINLPVRS